MEKNAANFIHVGIDHKNGINKQHYIEEVSSRNSKLTAVNIHCNSIFLYRLQMGLIMQMW